VRTLKFEDLFQPNGHFTTFCSSTCFLNILDLFSLTILP